MADSSDSHLDVPLDEALPSRDVLEAYTVPDLPIDFTDRVMASLHPSQVPLVMMKPPRAPWIVAATASVCAIAAVVALVLAQSRNKTEPAAPMPVETRVASVAAPVSAAPTGDLVIEVEPHDAIVRIDGVPIGDASGGSPFVRTNLATGPHLVEVERDGYLPWQRRVDLPARALPLTIVLRPAEASAPVATPELTSPEIGTPRVAPRSRPRPSRSSSSSASPGLKDPFGVADELETESTSGDMMDPFASNISRLSIRSDGSGPATILIDGKLVGTTPLVRLSVKPGKHVVAWKWSDGRIVTKRIEIAAGDAVLIAPDSSLD